MVVIVLKKYFIVAAAFFALFLAIIEGSTTTTEEALSSSHQTCSLTNLPFQSAENLIFYSITWDCYLYAWRNGNSPKQSDVGLNGTEKLMTNEGGTDILGPYVKSHGLTKRCNPDNGAISFIDRQGQQTPTLIVMVRYSEQFYSLIRINIEKLLESKPYVAQSLLPQLDGESISVDVGAENPRTCIFVNQDLHCFSSQSFLIKRRVFAMASRAGQTLYAESSTQDHTLSKLRDIEVLTATWNGINQSSVYIYDKLTDGWLHKLNTGETTANGVRQQYLHKFPKANGYLKNLWAIDQQRMIAVKCSAVQCQYYWVKLLPEAHSSFACLFISSVNVIAGVITDVRLTPISQLPVQSLPQQQALIADAGLSLPNAKNSYWPLILLVSICLLIVIVVLVAAFIYETVGFRRRYLIEQAADQKYAKIFWPDEELGVTIDENPNDVVLPYEEELPMVEAPPPPSKPKKVKPKTPEQPPKKRKPETPEQPKNKSEKQQPTSRLLYTQEDDKTPSSLKKSSKGNLRCIEEEYKTPSSLKKSSKGMSVHDELPKSRSTKKMSQKGAKLSYAAAAGKEKKSSNKEIRMSTHQPQALNQTKKKRRTTRSRKLLPVPDDVSTKSDKLPKEDKADAMESIKVKKLQQPEPLPSGERIGAPPTASSKNKKHHQQKPTATTKRKERRHRSKSKSKSLPKKY